MDTNEDREAVLRGLRRINRVWLDGQVEALVPLVDANVVMVFPNFAGRVQGREEFLAGFRDFCASAQVIEFHDYGYDADVIGDTAVITFQYEMIYERSGERYRATGRDLWVFRNRDNTWIAVWRTMLELHEQPA